MSSRIDRVYQAMICATCKHQEYQQIMNSWRYSGNQCNLWEQWNERSAN
jgi:hypothetical protein